MNVFNDCFILDLSQLVWIFVESNSKMPSMRAGHSCGFYQNDSMIIFGGGNVWGAIFGDLHIMDFGNFTVKSNEKKEKLTASERIQKLKFRIEKEHAKRLGKIENLRKQLSEMESEEQDFYTEIIKEFDDLNIEIKHQNEEKIEKI